MSGVWEGDEDGDDEGGDGDNGEEMKSEKGDASDEMWQTAEITENQRSIINMDTDSQPVWPKEEEQTPQTPSQVIRINLHFSPLYFYVKIFILGWPKPGVAV